VSHVTAKIYDLDSNELADISGIALEKSLSRRLNIARGFTIQAPATHELLTSVVADDGFPNLTDGFDRKLICWEDGGPGDQPIFHGRIHGTERVGNGTENLVTIRAFEPRMELGYEADDRAGRPVRGSTVAGGAYDGNFIDPQFVSSVDSGAAISGPDLIQQVLTNSVNTGAESDPSPGEGPLPIDISTGTFDLNVPPAIDLSVLDFPDWPMLIGDFINLLTDTNVVDVDERPVDPSEGFDAYVMTVLSAVSRQGTDRSGTVHFDYWTGDKNVVQCSVTTDAAIICNKLYDYLGPRLGDGKHWRGNITPGSPGTTVDPSASRARYGGSGGGEFMQIRAFDTLGVENTSRPLYIALWNAEASLRLNPRRMLFMTPSPDTKALFQAPTDFDVGDLVAANVGAALGIELAEAQRVYGYDKTWSREDAASISTLITSADAE
jgi:hypothetical protein